MKCLGQRYLLNPTKIPQTFDIKFIKAFIAFKMGVIRLGNQALHKNVFL